MLEINWEDVYAMALSVRPQLIIIGVVLLLAIVVTIAVRRRPRRTRKFARTQVWVAALVAVSITVPTMLYGGLQNVLNLASGSGTLSEGTVDAVSDLAHDISDEGITLLKNQEQSLPLAEGTALNVFGWASSNPVYGGTGSGSLSDSYDLTSIIAGLEHAGFDTNEALTDFYTAYRADRPVVGLFTDVDWTLPEPPASTYDDALLSEADDFADTSVVVIGRSGGEGNDLPQDVNAETSTNPNYLFAENSDDYREFEDGQGYLELTRSERDMIELAKSVSDTVVVVYNGAGAFEVGDLEDDPAISAILWAPSPGQVGFDALGRILAGEVNPSGRTPDTFVRELNSTPTAANFGDFDYTNMDEFSYEMQFTGEVYTPTFVNYVEGIYVGYRFWETAAVEGLIDYDEQIVYPFGYGLSYTSFTQEIDAVELSDDTVTVDVTVTNAGQVPGKDVVQVYYTPPYTDGGIEKAAVNLAAYDKTDILEPGESTEVTISFSTDQMASYDAETAGAYVLEQGDYGISLRADSHTVLGEETVTVDETRTYDTAENTHAGDEVPAINRFDAAAGEGTTYLSRAGGFANFEAAVAAPATTELPDSLKSEFVDNSVYDPAAHDDPADEMPTTGDRGDLRLSDLVGADHDDPRWEQLLDQMTFEEMDSLIANGGYQTVAVDSVGKVMTLDVDGPAALINNFTGVGSIGLPANVMLAATWNVDIAHQFGDAIGSMAQEMQVAGWYAPSINMHRSAFGGRNFEYFSEDPLLAGSLSANQIQGASEHGVYAFVKHLGLNDQETNRMSKLMTWSQEQAIREIYLRPFEIAVKEGEAGAIMSAYNYIGTEYAGADPQLLQTVLRDEWGFRGMVITDYFAGFGYQNADQIIRNGGDLMLATVDYGDNHVQDRSATSLHAMRDASHNILYTVANSWVYADGEPDVPTPAWEYIAWSVLALVAVVVIMLEIVTIRRWRARGASPEPMETAQLVA